uniref:THUMP domain-containing protein n=1 Tax=Heterorhabditis bacteriophora TaxID=37862 RepID=A0A1I7X090_HETBA
MAFMIYFIKLLYLCLQLSHLFIFCCHIQELYSKTAWHFDRREKKKAAAYDVFKKAIAYVTNRIFRTDPSVLDECDISEDAKEKLLEDIRKKLTPQAVKVQFVNNITLKKKKLMFINLIAAPHFVVTTQTLDRENGLGAVHHALDVVKQTIEKFGGKFAIKEEKLELLELEEEDDSGSGDEEDSGEDDDGLVAPKGLDQQMDAEEASRDAKKKENKDKGEEDNSGDDSE